MSRYENNFQDCYVRMDDKELIIGNDAMERIWSISKNIPVAKSLRNKKTNKEWSLDGESFGWISSATDKYAFYHSLFTTGNKKNVTVESEADNDFGIAKEHLKITVTLDYDGFLVKWIHLLYPGLAVHRYYFQVEKGDEPVLESRSLAEMKRQGEANSLDELEDDYFDAVPLAPAHCKWKSVQFFDRTDDNDNLVFTQKGIITRRESRYVHGNLLFLQDSIDKESIIFVKEGPTPFAYIGNTVSDFYLTGQSVFTTGWGLTADDFDKAKQMISYGGAVILSDSEENVYTALHDYHGAIHEFKPEKDAFVMSNTWGDQSCDGRVSEAFILNELERAPEVGVTFYQIDDGWQNGTTSNSVNPGGTWSNYYRTNADFWEVNPKRFPNGLEPIIRSAEEKGIKMGLWFSPDSSNDFENWEKDSQRLVSLYKQYGITAFKLDGIKITSKYGENNLARLMQRVLKETDGNVIFNTDVTADIRNGFYGRVHYGSLFIENRFTGNFGEWPNYYPYRTLRNLWMLSKYYPTSRMQMEFLNVKKNEELYAGDVLAPNKGGIEYSFAVTMFANPLAWMELTGLDEESVSVLSNIIHRYRKVQPDILSGHVMPIGEEPVGTSWTGFQSIASEDSGYLLIIKEYNDLDSWEYTLHKVKGKELELECILGDGGQKSVTVDSRGRAIFELKGTFSYALYKYSPSVNGVTS